jgi:lipoprotein-anchoring transpeptidase ErfK/SrfK
MLRRVSAICVGLASTLCTASAQQDCEYIAYGCQGPVIIEPQALFPFLPSPPRAAAPPIDPGYERQPRDIAPSFDTGYEREPIPRRAVAPSYDPALSRQYAALYGRLGGEPFPVPAIRLSDINPIHLRTSVDYQTNEPAGTIIVDPQNKFLYLVQGGGRAMRYGIGVGRQGFGWSGVATIHEKQEWPDWYPPKEMLQRQPELMRQMSELRGGIGMPGGSRNPLGARALYLWQNGKDTLYRIHGTFEPWTIGTSVSSGCIRMINQDVIDLYQRVATGAKVVVLR